MSGQIVGQVIGTIIGTAVGGPIGGMIGGGLGGAVGSSFDSLPTQYGPRLEDLRVQKSEYGAPIPIVYGTVAIQGNVIWAADIKEVKTETEQGGKGGPSQTTVNYSYFGSFAVLLCEGEIGNIGRIWAGPARRLIWDGAILESGSLRVYRGTDDQEPDPLIEQYEGVGNVPAYRGYAYIVIEDFELAKDGNTLPFLTVEVGAKAGAHGQTPVYLGATLPTPNFSAAIAAVDPSNGWIWNVVTDSHEPAPTYSVTVINDADKSVVATFPNLPLAILGGYVLNVVPFNGMMYVVQAQFPGAQVASASDYRDTNLAIVDIFFSGSANADGTTSAAPRFVGSTAFGSLRLVHDTFFRLIPDVGVVAIDEGNHRCDPFGPSGPPLGLLGGGSRTETDVLPANPEYATAAGTDGSRLWIAYAFSNVATSHVYAFTGPRDFVGGEIGEIGAPIQIQGDNRYIGIAGVHGAGANNFAVFDSSGPPSLLHLLSVPHAESGKVFDYDPKRHVFLSYRPNSTMWDAVDAVTGEITTRELTIVAGDTSPAPTTYITAVTYSSRTDRYLFGATSGLSGTGTTIYVVNPDTGTVEGTYTFEEGGQMINPLLDPVATRSGAPYVLSFDQGHVKRLYIAGAVTVASIGLGEIVEDISLRAGLTTSQIDVTALTDAVDGYAIARQTTVRAAIDALRPAYFFDAVESQGVIKYVKRGGAAVATIDDADLGACDPGAESPDPLKTVRRMEVELPRSVNVKYLLAADDYSQATKEAKRLIGASGDAQTIESPLVMSDAKAQEVADVNLHAAWAERLSYQFTLPRKYSHLEPTDLIVVKGHLMRLTKINATPRGILECEAIADETTYYVPHVVVTETTPNGNTVAQPGETLMELF